MTKREIIIKETHRALWYEDGVLVKILEAGRYEFSPGRRDFWGKKRPAVEFVLVDVRERELTIKGQEILTADKVAIRVSIIVHFRVTDPKAAVHRVEKYEERLYSDVQLAARRSLASMQLEEILTNRNRLSEDILHDVQEIATDYGVSILRADVKDLIFPGNLQEIMNKVLAAERMSEAQLVEARTKAPGTADRGGGKGGDPSPGGGGRGQGAAPQGRSGCSLGKSAHGGGNRVIAPDRAGGADLFRASSAVAAARTRSPEGPGATLQRTHLCQLQQTQRPR